MYSKVNTDMNFVEREKKLKSSGKKTTHLRKVWSREKAARHIPL